MSDTDCCDYFQPGSTNRAYQRLRREDCDGTAVKSHSSPYDTAGTKRDGTRAAPRARAVSDVLGFVLVFSLIVATVGIVYTGGMAELGDTRDAERINNAERAFDVLADNLQQLGRGEAPSRATEIRLAEARLSTTQNRPLVTNRTGANVSTRLNPVAIEYAADGPDRVVYETGAILRTSEDGGVMLREPDFVFGENRTVLRYIEPRGSGQAVGGTTTVLVRGEVRTAELLDRGADAEVILRLQTDPDRSEIWLAYFEAELDWAEEPCEIQSVEAADTEEVVCEFETDLLYVSHTRVQVEIT